MGRAVILILALSASSCVPNTAWRLPPDARQWSDCRASQRYSVLHEGGPNEGYTLSFVEFDDFGEFFSRCQLDNALQAIAEAKAAARPDPRSGKRGALVVIFVHGWKNNASDKTGNVWGFRESLRDLAKVTPEGWPVVGVYI